jgi:hypothetical protein
MKEPAMRYEVRVDGGSIGVFATPEEALERVRQALAEDPDHEPEIIDMETGRAFEPAATEHDREHLANKVGF